MAARITSMMVTRPLLSRPSSSARCSPGETGKVTSSDFRLSITYNPTGRAGMLPPFFLHGDISCSDPDGLPLPGGNLPPG